MLNFIKVNLTNLIAIAFLSTAILFIIGHFEQICLFICEAFRL